MSQKSTVYREKSTFVSKLLNFIVVIIKKKGDLEGETSLQTFLRINCEHVGD